MRILLTNDDGIHSEGILKLYQTLSKNHDCSVIAPDRETSATSHAITLSTVLRTSKIRDVDGMSGYAVSGTPADCVKIGIKALLKKKPNLVISGINRGLNVGANLLYSGTVSAAIEASILGVNAISVSQELSKNMDFSRGAIFIESLLHDIKGILNKQGVLLNVNIPSQNIRGVKITSQAKSISKESFDKRVDPRGNKYYWLKGNLVDQGKDSSSDERAISKGYVSITPLHIDMTDYNVSKKLKNINLNFYHV